MNFLEVLLSESDFPGFALEITSAYKNTNVKTQIACLTRVSHKPQGTNI